MTQYVVCELNTCDYKAILAIEQSRVSAWTPQQLLSQFEQPNNYVIRNQQGLCMAFAFYQVVFDEATLLLVVVNNSVRRQGVAGHLLRESMRRLMLAGVARCYLEVRESNRPAYTLYRQLGFEKIGLRKKYYASLDQSKSQQINGREHAVVMQKLLSE